MQKIMMLLKHSISFYQRENKREMKSIKKGLFGRRSKISRFLKVERNQKMLKVAESKELNPA